MPLNPSVLIQLMVSAICTMMICMASGFAVQSIRHWDIQSGSEKQLIFERRTYLISTLLGFCFVVELFLFLLFIQTCESISNQFVGAMCATGVLNTSAYGWPVLFLKIFIFFGSAVWLLVNHVDNKGYDYPLIKIKYSLLLVLLPLMIFETIHLFLFFSGLKPDLIVSCCGSLFSKTATGFAADVSGIEPKTAALALGGSGIVFFITGIVYLYTSRTKTCRANTTGISLFFGTLSVVTFGIALAAVVSLISLYVYEHPHHHCPFCMLKSGYNFVGYFLYIPLFSGTAAAVGVTIVNVCQRYQSLSSFVRPMEKKLVWFSMSMFVFFYVLAIVLVSRSSLTMRFWYA